MLDICLHVLHGGLVAGEDIVEKGAIFAARFDARKQRIERFGDMAAETQFQRQRGVRYAWDRCRSERSSRVSE